MGYLMSADGGELIRDALWFDDGFTTIPNSWARDPNITHQARGLLVQLTSHKAGFRISITGLMAGAVNGRDAIQGQLNELQRAGYLQRTSYQIDGLKRFRYRLRDPHAPVDNRGQGRFDLSTSQEKNPRSAQCPDFQDTGNPDTGNPSTENPDAKEEHLKKNINGYLPEVTTERPVDNFPTILTQCAGRGGKLPHVWTDSSGDCRDCGASRLTGTDWALLDPSAPVDTSPTTARIRSHVA